MKREVTFPFDADTFDLFRWFGIGCVLDSRGITVKIATGMTEEQCRAMVAEELVLHKKRRELHKKLDGAGQ